MILFQEEWFNFLLWVFIGPVLGALVRPVGGWLSDKINSGSRVTAYSTVAQIIAALAVAYFVMQAKESSTPEQYWWPFFGCFMILFITTGIGNGSTFRSIPYIFNKEQAGPVPTATPCKSIAAINTSEGTPLKIK